MLSPSPPDTSLVGRVPAGLPPELWHRIASFSSRGTVASLSCVQRGWNTVLDRHLYESIDLVFDPITPHVTEQVTLRLLWHLAQNPRHAAMVRRLEIRGQPITEFSICCKQVRSGDWGCKFASTETQPSIALGHGIPSDAKLYAASACKMRTCLRAAEENSALLWAHLCIALLGCRNLVQVFLPYHRPSYYHTLNLCERAVQILVSHIQNRGSSDPSLSLVQVPWSYFDRTEGNHWSLVHPPESARLIEYLSHPTAITSSNKLPCPRLLAIAGFGDLHPFLVDMALSRVSVVAVEEYHALLRLFPGYYTTSARLERYMLDIAAFLSRFKFNTLQMTLHSSQLCNIGSMLHSLANAFGDGASQIKHLRLNVMSRYEAAGAGWVAHPTCVQEVGAAHRLVDAIRHLPGLKACNLCNVNGVHGSHAPLEHLPFGRAQFKAVVEQTGEGELRVELEGHWPE